MHCLLLRLQSCNFETMALSQTHGRMWQKRFRKKRGPGDGSGTTVQTLHGCHLELMNFPVPYLPP